MKHSTSQQKRNNLRILVVFCVVVGLAIIASLVYRLFTLISASSFDGKHSYTVAFIKERDVDYLTLHPQQKQVSHVAVRGKGTVSEKHEAIGIIPDGSVTLPSAFDKDKDISGYFNQALFHAGEIKTKLTAYDLFRLMLATHGMKASSLQSEEIHLPADEQGLMAITEIAFKDQTIDDENKSVSIVNATGVPGLGKQFETVVANMGGNVITLKNDTEERKITTVQYYGDSSYTVERLSKLLKVKPQNSTLLGLSDIIIVIGKDQLER